MSFIEYVESLKKIDFEDEDKRIHVVLGNEACDLDSAVCALVTGYYHWKIDSDTTVAVLNIPRCDYCLKSEVQHVLNELGIRANSLLFLDSINLTALHEEDRLKITLVDHNVLSDSLAALENTVVRIIDHHKWEWQASNDVEIHWAETGSCATLVGEIILSTKKQIIDKTVAKLLQSAIIIDTVNFSEKAMKFKPKDLEIFNQFKSLYTADVDWTAEYNKLRKAKEDIRALDVCDLLRKDLKVVRGAISIAIPSVPLSLDEFLALENLEEQMEQFRRRGKFDSIVVMINKCHGDELERFLIVFGDDLRLVESISEKLKTFEDPSLRLESINSMKTCFNNERFPILILRQDNVTVSRKVVLPLLKEFATSYK